MALMKMTGMAGVSSFSRASAITPVWTSQRAPGGTARRRVRVALRGDGWQERARAAGNRGPRACSESRWHQRSAPEPAC